MKKTTVSKKQILLAIAAAFIALAGSASAQVLTGAAFDQDVKSGNPPLNPGVLGETFVGSNLLSFSLADGVSVSVADVLASQGDNYQGAANITPYRGLDYTNRANSPEGLTITLEGLTAGDQYEVVAYSDIGETVGFTDGGSETLSGVSTSGVGGNGVVTQSHPLATSFIQGDDYVESLETANSSGDIVFTATGSQYSYIQGVGIESVPEPSTYALLGLGGLGLLGARARRIFQG